MAEQHRIRGTLDIAEQDHVQGPASAAVTLVEYGDFECPYSREAVKTVQILQQQFAEHLRFVFRHFPLTAKHPHAMMASEAAEAAASQGRFWPMYGMIFAHQWELDYSHLIDYADRLGLDRELFGRALDKHLYKDRVRLDVASGRQIGVTGTPTFLVNGVRQDGPGDHQALATAISQILEKKR